MNNMLINKIKEQVSKIDKNFLLNHIYDYGDNWLVSVKTKKDSDLMDPYYIANKKTLKLDPFAMLNDLPRFNKALKNKVY